MRNSIGFKLLLGINGIIIFFLLLIFFINSQFLGQYYISQKKNTLSDVANKVNSIYKGNPQILNELLNQYENTKGMRILIFSNDNIIKYDTLWRSFNNPQQGGQNVPLPPPDPNKKPIIMQIEGFEIRYESQLKTDFLAFLKHLNNGDFIELGIPISAIQESVAISNQFLIFVGIFTIIIGSLVAFLFSRSFTKPVLQLNEIAKNMSQLDFSKKYTSQSKDEIGTLGRSINSLSNQLNFTMTELRDSNAKLENDIKLKIKLDDMRKELIYGISHELKTPITIIQGYAEGLKSNINQDVAGRELYCNVIMDETRKMNKMIMELLELAQIESGYMKLEKEEFNLSELIYNVLERLQIVFNENKIKIDTNIDKSAIVNADQSKIEQVLLNYLSNAINHVDFERKISIRMQLNGETVRVSVYNSGKNIPIEETPYIWDSFYKLDKSRAREYGGTGLGLSIVRAIQSQHGTDYGVQNLQNGVEFWFDINLI